MSLLGLKGKRTSIITLLVELTARLIPQIVKQGQHANQLKFSKRSIRMLIPFCFEISQVVWFFTCFGVILLGVDVGLGVGVICALFAVVLSLSR